MRVTAYADPGAFASVAVPLLMRDEAANCLPLGIIDWLLKAVLSSYVQQAIATEKAGLKVDFKAKRELNLPEELTRILGKDRKLAKAFPSLTPGRQRAYVLHLEVLPPAKVAEIRERLGLSQRQAGELLGGGPRAFQKYEAGSQTPSVPMSHLLKLLARDPSRLKELGGAPKRTLRSTKATAATRSRSKIKTALG